MAIENFIPELWTSRLLVSLRKAQVAAALVNRDYEGEIRRQGDTVHITSINDVTIGNYTAHNDITVEDIDDDTRTLIIDQAKYFAVEIDDIEKAQQVAGGNALAQAVDNASYQLKDIVDTYLLAAMADGATNELGAVNVSGDGAAYGALVDLAVSLDEANVPDSGRFVVVSPEFHGLLLKDDRFISAGDDPAAATRANGRVGQAAGLQVHKSNNLPDNADASYKVGVAGYRGATTYAEQIVSMEGARMEKRFADMVKGLHVYGSLVTRPTGLATVELNTTGA
ncbi:MAG TPA: hypothetical protein VK059_14845 [Nocardioidaceae bacterium]|nr:hypothetical protein [Nocardioidaceae bacterium]